MRNSGLTVLIMAVKMADEGKRQRFVEMHNYDGKNMQFGFFILARAAEREREKA